MAPKNKKPVVDRSDPLWYKDAIIYQTHVKSFHDANNDGVGDFAGLTEKLDYIKDLGVSAIWLMPFYPSPLRDDGYDIQDYRSINPSYGTMRDVKRFIDEAHRRDLRVITELVINHTSDQHPWFQRARQAKPGSRYRDYYVWSDTDDKYADTRIIFLDTEKSNWTWDPVAKAYFWHRFYSHQPDLNFDHPPVMEEIRSLLHYWLKMGIDGLRLDAIPYLIEREGTNCENLPETHVILKRIRAEMEEHFPDRMLLAEANQWPEDTFPYFGDGDECHMAFHFPLMPRMYMAVAQEDRAPITDIMRQTPEIPANCQWAIFLRNHDELTLEMVTENERDYLWNTYAADRRARINLGIRRRLAPLMDNDRRKIELMNSLLLSMPGTPVLYYGDEIGMGDNIYLGDRDGVRTPMQWSPDRNGGFSRANPQALYLPPVMDPLFGFDAVNVEAQSRSASSLLQWMRRLITVRRQHKAFSRGTLDFIYPGNRKILAYTRSFAGETILCVVNLSRNSQPVELQLQAHKGRTPVELMGRTTFPPIGDLPYMLTVPGHGFYWFALADEVSLPDWHVDLPEPLPEFITLVMTHGWESLAEPRNRKELEDGVLASFLANQRWFAAKDAGIARLEFGRHFALPGAAGGPLLAEIAVHLAGGGRQTYCLPLALAWGEENLSAASPLRPFTLAKIRRGPKVGVLYDATAGDDLALDLLDGIRHARSVETASGVLRFSRSPAFAAVELADRPEVTRLSVEQSNTSLMLDRSAIIKLYRRPLAGPHPEVEIGRFLTDVAGFANTPPLLGSLDFEGEEGATTLAAAFGFVLNQGDGWAWTLDHLARELETMVLEQEGEGEPLDGEPFGVYLQLAATIGQRTAELHRAFATPTDDPAFRPEPIEAADRRRWVASIEAELDRATAIVERAARALEGDEAEAAKALIEAAPRLRQRIAGLGAVEVEATKTRLHGDYHLGQVLIAKGDVYILDFEGEPQRDLEERRAKTSPLKDVAGMLRSLDYGAVAALDRFAERDPVHLEEVRSLAATWREAAMRRFLESYREHAAGCGSVAADRAAFDAVLELFLIEKAAYEIAYEAANRPGWLGIPVRGVLGLLDPEQRKGLFGDG
ncbi:MAG: maltose alpha-D-glucosyltransferase [Geminicoccaceae bacterium]